MKINEILEDISIAIIVLTRVPINNILSINQHIEIHRGQWAYPIVGASIGLVLFLLICLFEGIGIPRQIALLISLSLGILLTGALHEDGVADFFDSLGGRDYTARQKILKDSRLGTYGVLALIIVFMLKFFLILGLESRLALACGLIACSSLSRFSILLLVNYSNLSKQAGLTKHLKKVMGMALNAHKKIGCKGVTRSDFKFFKDKFYLLELNTQPGMTKLSLVPEIASYKGISFLKLIKWILKDASKKK